MASKQEYLMKLQMLEQEAAQFGEQLKIIDQQIKELGVLKNNLNLLNKQGEAETYSEFGKGIFIKTKLQKGDLLVDVGSKVMVPKKPKEVSKIVDDQVEKFNQAKKEIEKKIQELNKQVDVVVKNAKAPEKKSGKKK